MDVLVRFTLITVACLVSCAGPEKRSQDVQLERLAEVLRYVQSEYIVSIDNADLVKAAIAGMYTVAEMKGEGVSAPSTDPWDSLVSAYYDIQRKTSLNLKTLIDGAIAGVMRRLDVHSVYLDAARLQALYDPPREGAVGLSLQQIDGRLLILDTIEGSAAEALQIVRGDRLLKIENELVQGLQLDAIVRRLRGAPGSRVNLTIERKGEQFGVVAKRSVLKYNSVYSALYPGNVGYIKIKFFNNTTTKDLRKHIAGLRLATMSKPRAVVLDLRGNSGGTLNAVVGVGDVFISNGLILYTHGRGKDSKLKFLATPQPDELDADVPMVVLVDAKTASGAEMLAMLLQDHKRARVLGTTTVGSGSIQTILRLSDGDALQLTIAKIYSPDGRPIEDWGVIPDVCITNGKAVFLDRTQVEKTGNARTACPAEAPLYEKESDDIALRTALDMQRIYKKAKLGESRERNALNEYRGLLALSSGPN